ncbi:MAG: T9SS type A sorting domain-containing protein [Bacteroidales bacterium]|nr:T9SS type A sorting domain-containing protein [Bacteroidales bacterium]
MKRILLIISFIVMAHNVSSQSVTIYEKPYKDYIGSMTALELDDGNIIEIENYCLVEVSEDGQTININTLGINIIKINDKTELLDSLFVAFPKPGMSVSAKCILTKNPYEYDSYILADFYHNAEDGKYYYTAILFDGDLNITDTIDVPFEYDNVNVIDRSYSFIDNDNDIVFCARWENEPDIIFVKMDLFGNVNDIFFSDLSLDEYLFKKASIFVYEENPLRYGFFIPKITDQPDLGGYVWDGQMAVIILNKEMEISKTIHIHYIDEKVWIRPTIEMYEMVRLNDGNFATCLTVMDTKDNRNISAIQMTKFNTDFEVLQHYRFFEEISSQCPFITNTGGMALCDDGSLHVNYIKRDLDTGVNTLYAAYIDNNFNVKWNTDIYTTKPKSFYNSPTIYSSCARKNGGVIISAWGDLTCNENSMSYFPLMFIINNNESIVNENINYFRPYSFYPNPTSDVLNIRFSPDVNAEKVEIYCMDGKLYREQNFNMETINVNDLSSGIYMMKMLLDNGETFTEKIVIK